MSNIVDPCERARRTFVGRVSVTEMLITASRTRSAITSRVQNQPLTPGPFSPNLLRDNNNLSEDPGVFFFVSHRGIAERRSLLRQLQ